MAAYGDADGTRAAVRELLTTYNDLNGARVEELDHEPSPLEFMRFVARNTPFVVRQGAASWKSHQKWTPDYLKDKLAGQRVNVAITPHGNADAPTFSPRHDSTVIAKPHEEEQAFDEFLDYVTTQELGQGSQSAEVRYAQTQNDNFRNEYISLFADAQSDIPFARIALQKEAEAINLWIGNSCSVTCLHRDPMENIYVQVLGRKHFILLPPLCHPCVNEKMMQPATYTRTGGVLTLEADEEEEMVPLATWDPDKAEEDATEFSHLAKPVRVTLDPGDMLYLPAMWYHKVKQSSNEEGCVVAMNYWYDMDYSGPFYPSTTFIRNLGVSDQN
ncbi:putative pla2g4b [Emericellopsis atlantica]|uniref:Pla2g4b n=1 Tax=Emericellopsis atlantica TaxID=2614577 RepID=A0A9P8CSZ9_9HYPO|nr:putative pla2g4b [Emericellopsis atlantica]KAG9258313.1 putative pla2g4b [Emericellopsis atlantica]